MQSDSESSSSSSSTCTSSLPWSHQQSYLIPQDIHSLYAMLSKTSTNLPPLPIEIIDIIVDYAEYWVCVSHASDHAMSGQYMNHPYLLMSKETTSFPLFYRTKKIVFEFYAHDQGYSTDSGTWTWAECTLTSLSTVNEELLSRTELYKNKERIGTEWQNHVFEVGEDTKIAQHFDPRKDLQIVVFVRSWFPGWIHYVEKGRICIYYSIRPFDL